MVGLPDVASILCTALETAMWGVAGDRTTPQEGPRTGPLLLGRGGSPGAIGGRLLQKKTALRAPLVAMGMENPHRRLMGAISEAYGGKPQT